MCCGIYVYVCSDIVVNMCCGVHIGCLSCDIGEISVICVVHVKYV